MMTSFPLRAYFICCDARTGSNLLAATLRETDIAGKPFEFFNEGEIDKPWLRDILQAPRDIPFTGFRDWRDYIVRAGVAHTGVFGACVHWFQLDNAIATFAMTSRRDPVRTLRAFFPELRLIWLRRDNVVAQAISHHVAIATGVWNIERSQSEPASPGDRDAPYDFAAIDGQVNSAIVAAEGWRTVLAGAEDLTLALSYEDLAADLAGSTRKVLRHLGLDAGDMAMPPAPMRKQAGPWSLELERRYREERRARGLAPIGETRIH
jgi:LPS sulfotransferase NodH